MSSTLPPSEPPFQPSGQSGQSGQPGQPGQPGPPPVGPPAEILASGSGTAIAGDGGKRGGGKGVKRGLLIGGGVLGLAVVGGGAWAAMSFFSTGAQPAEALPAGTLGYISIDLDPSGGQKIEALRTLDKFPALKDKVGVSGDTDLRKSIFDAIQDDAKCDGLDFADDIEPWLGDRAAIAAVKDSDGKPKPVLAVQVKDAGAADTGLKTLAACGQGATADDAGWVIDGDWAVVAETKAIAQATVDAAKKSTLADDATYQKWTGETGDPGVSTLYAAPAAGPAILEQLGDEMGSMPDDLKSKVGDFKGVAATIRFTDGTLEMQAAGETPKGASDVVGTSSVADQVGSLPDDTAAVLGISLGKDWFQTLLDSAGSALSGTGASSDDVIQQIEQATGLSLPEDIETLTGDGVVLAVGPGLDPEAIANSASSTPDVPVALKLKGDATEIEAVIAKLQAAVPPGFLSTATEGDTVVVGPSQTYLDSLTGDGGLGDSAAFKKVVPNADSPTVLYLNFDQFDALLDSLGAPADVIDNVKPLAGFGISSTTDGDTSRLVVRIGTDD